MSKKLSHPDRTILLSVLSEASLFATVRGRQALVHNAVGGYPASGEIFKALGWVDLEGSPFEVAFDLIEKLDGQDLVPGIPALAAITDAIEPMAGAHREKLAQLRQRMQWGSAEQQFAPAADWRDVRPAPEIVEERIIGENTLRPLNYLRRALVAADAVVRVDLDGVPMGTGFLVAPDLMMTNHHVIHNANEAQGAQACFYNEVPDEDDRNRAEFRREQVIARAAGKDSLLYTNKALDVSVIRLQGSPQLRRYLPLRRVEIKQNDRVVIIQHPGGYPKQISLQNNLVAYADKQIVQYYTSTKGGSSGSPVLDDSFAVIAVHHGWVHNKAWDGAGQIRGAKAIEDMQYRNEGTSVIALLEDVEKDAPALAAELTVLGG